MFTFFPLACCHVYPVVLFRQFQSNIQFLLELGACTPPNLCHEYEKFEVEMTHCYVPT